MAASRGDVSTFELYECQVCLTDMVERNPRMLACHHSFCEDCLSELLTTGQILCPSCREVTIPKDGDVRNLSMNFYLLQMMEKDFSITEVRNASVCGLCKTNPALVKCEKCIKLLCGKCKKKHDSIPGKEKHLTYDLCLKHGDSIEHVCMECIRPVCMTCIVEEHDTHQDHLMEFTEGVEEVKSKLEELSQAVAFSSKSLMNIEENIQSRLDSADKQRLQVKEKREFYLQQLANLDKIEKGLDKTCEQDRKLLNELLETSHLCEQNTTRLISLKTHEEPKTIIEGFGVIKKHVQQALEKVKLVLSMGDTLPSVDEYLSEALVSVGIHTKPHPVSCSITRLKIILNIKGNFVKLKFPTDVASCELGGLVADYEMNQVVEFDLTGKIVQLYNPPNASERLSSVSVYRDYVYILQASVITKISRKNAKDAQSYIPGINNMDRILVVDPATIIISARSAGKVYRYNTETNTTNLLLEGLDRPIYITMATTEQGLRYAVTELGQHKVHVYDNEWTLLTSVGGHGSSAGRLDSPRSIIVTPSSDLLVADWGNHRISKFSLDGKFRQHLLTDKDGIRYPLGLAYMYPHLWLTENSHNLWSQNHAALKCYLIE